MERAIVEYSFEVPHFRVVIYVAPSRYWKRLLGKLYEELGRAWLWEEGCDQHANSDGWNTYEVVAGSYIAREGIIGLQLHKAFGPSEIQFKDMELERDSEFHLTTLQ